MQRNVRLRGLVFGLCSLSVIPLLFPADVPFIDDEATLMARALGSLQHQHLPAYGLVGTAGLAYGPFPTAFYALALFFTRDLVSVATIHALCATLAVAAAIYLLARACECLEPWVGLLALVSPYLWFYDRTLWDNPFLVPLSALAIASYVAFCARPAPWKLALCVATATLMLLTHLMALPTIAAIGLHLVLYQRAWLKARPWLTSALLASALLVSTPYLVHLLGDFHIRPGKAEAGVTAYAFALLGAHFMTGLGLDYFFGPAWLQHAGPTLGRLLEIAAALSGVAWLLSWYGIVLAVQHLRRPRPTGAPAPAETALAFVAVMAIVLQMLLNGISGLYGLPHYYNSTWFAFFALIWLALSRLGRAGRALALLSGLCQACVLGYAITSIHASEGNRRLNYGPTLGTQIALVRALTRYDPHSELRNHVSHYVEFPNTLAVLQRFYLTPPQPGAKRAKLLIRYRSPASDEGALMLEELPR